jgi:hypothetical protein
MILGFSADLTLSAGSIFVVNDVEGMGIPSKSRRLILPSRMALGVASRV